MLSVRLMELCLPFLLILNFPSHSLAITGLKSSAKVAPSANHSIIGQGYIALGKKIGTLRNFWDKVKDDDHRIQRHKMLGQRKWRERNVPLNVHGDNAHFILKNNSLLCGGIGIS